jgi:restriction system protein
MRKRNRYLERLIDLPWWVSLIVAALVFVGATYAFTVIPTGKGVSPVADAPKAGFMLSLPFLLIAVASAVRHWLQRQLLDQQRNLDSIRDLSWQEFETLIGEAFRRQGYSVTQHGGVVPDGGIDLVLQKAGSISLVQCKRWQARQVDITLVRELYDVMTAEGANEAIVVTCGEYTEDAREFATGKPIHLIHGERLLEMIRSVQGSRK